MDCGIEAIYGDRAKPKDYLSFTQSTDLDIILVSPKCNEIIVHPLVNKIIHSIYLKNPLYFGIFLVLVTLDILSTSFLCMAEEIEIFTMLRHKRSATEVGLVVASITWMVLCTLYKMGKFLLVVKLSQENKQSDFENRLTSSNESVNLLLNQDQTDFSHFHKQLKSAVYSRLLTEAFWMVIGTVARISFITLSVMQDADKSPKQNIIFISTMALFFECFFHDAYDIFCIPNSVMISLLSMKKALGSFVVSIPAILLFVMPFLLIAAKFSLREGYYFANIQKYQTPPEGEEATVITAVGWSLFYLYKVMLTDGYPVTFFTESHPEFFLVYHIVTVFLLSLVVMNLIIAQTSQTYEEFADNSKAEILKHRIFTITLFGLYEHAEQAVMGQTVIADDKL